MFRLDEGRRRAGLVAELPNQNVRRRVTLAKIRLKILRLHGSGGIEDEGSRIRDAELRSVRRHGGVEQAVASDHLRIRIGQQRIRDSLAGGEGSEHIAGLS